MRGRYITKRNNERNGKAIACNQLFPFSLIKPAKQVTQNERFSAATAAVEHRNELV